MPKPSLPFFGASVAARCFDDEWREVDLAVVKLLRKKSDQPKGAENN